MASSESGDDSLYPIAVLIDELRNEDVQVIEEIISDEMQYCGMKHCKPFPFVVSYNSEHVSCLLVSTFGNV